MTKYEVRPYKDGDSFWIEPMAGIFEPLDFMRSQTNELALMPNSHAHTILMGEKIIAIVGFTVFRPGVAEVWSLLAEEIKRIPLLIHKGVLGGLRFYGENLNIHRWQAFVKKDYAMGVKWIQALGFQLEGELRKFGLDGSDSLLFGRVV